MRRALLVALSVALVSEAGANGVERAPLRGSAVVAAPSYPVDFAPPMHPEPVPVAVAPPVHWVPPVTDPAVLPFRLEVGGRYWFSFGKLAKSLYDLPSSSGMIVSRLTYDGLTSHSGEIFARADHPIGFFVKGYGGLSGFQKGYLKDEDFFPFIDPYSSTLSEQRSGHLHYATVDVGYTVWKTPKASIGGFVGYNFLGEQARAYGCEQVAANPYICVPTIDASTLAITEDSNFHSMRLGIAGELWVFDCLRFNAEAAWLPFVMMRGTDHHWLRIGTNPGDFVDGIPQSGRGDGFQLEATIAYQATKNFSFGGCWRYWRLDTKGTADFGGAVVAFPAGSQPLNFTTERYGFFLQGAYRL
jgi:hypothetical protein